MYVDVIISFDRFGVCVGFGVKRDCGYDGCVMSSVIVVFYVIFLVFGVDFEVGDVINMVVRR